MAAEIQKLEERFCLAGGGTLSAVFSGIQSVSTFTFFGAQFYHEFFKIKKNCFNL